MKIKKLILSPAVIISFLPAFTFFIFGWSTMFLSNYKVFEFAFLNVIGIGFCATVLAHATLLLVALLLKKIGLVHYFLSLLFGLGMGFFIQGFFLDNNFGLLDGHEIDWTLYHKQGIISLVVWIISLAIPFLICMIKKENGIKFLRNMAGILIGVQLCSLAAQMLLSGTQFFHEEAEKNSSRICVTQENIFDFSKTSNTIVLIVDALDCQFATEIIKDAHYAQFFNGFTLYSNVVGKYTTTPLSVPYIITGHGYNYENPYSEYKNKAFEDSEILQMLSEFNYSTGVFTIESYIASSDDIDNFQKSKATLTNPEKFFEVMTRLTAFRLMPQSLKNHFVVSTSDFLGLTSIQSSGDLYNITNTHFTELLNTENVTADIPKPCFRLYHIQGSHEPYTLDRNGMEVKESDALEQTRGVFELINIFFSKLREEGIYENSNILILADHGRLGMKQNPCCMLKRSNEQHPLRIDDVPLSYEENLIPTIMSLITGEENEKSFDRVDRVETDPITRTVCSPINTVLNHKEYYYSAFEYSSSGHARDFYKFRQNGVIHSPNIEDDAYLVQLGKSFQPADFIKNPLWGWASITDNHSRYISRWEAPFVLRLDQEINEDLVLSVEIDLALLFPGEFELYLNGESLGTSRLTADQGKIEFLIPSESIPENGVMSFALYPIFSSDFSASDIDEFAVCTVKEMTIQRASAQTQIADEDAEANEWHLVPRDLKNAQLEEDNHSVLIHSGGERGGYFITLPTGEYEMVVTGEGLEDATCYLSSPPEEDREELERSDSSILLRFQMRTLTRRCNFVVVNKGEQDMIVDDVIIRKIA